jgi:hypothetical protein
VRLARPRAGDQGAAEREQQRRADEEQRAQGCLAEDEGGERHRLRQHQRQRAPLALAREQVEAGGDDHQRQQEHQHEGEIEAARGAARGVARLGLFHGDEARPGRQLQRLRQELALAERERRQRRQRQARRARQQLLPDGGRFGGVDRVAHVGAAHGRRLGAQLVDPRRLRLRRRADQGALGAQRAPAAEGGEGDHGGEHAEDEPQRAVAPRQRPLHPHHRPEHHVTCIRAEQPGAEHAEAHLLAREHRAEAGALVTEGRRALPRLAPGAVAPGVGPALVGDLAVEHVDERAAVALGGVGEVAVVGVIGADESGGERAHGQRWREQPQEGNRRLPALAQPRQARVVEVEHLVLELRLRLQLDAREERRVHERLGALEAVLLEQAVGDGVDALLARRAAGQALGEAPPQRRVELRPRRDRRDQAGDLSGGARHHQRRHDPEAQQRPAPSATRPRARTPPASAPGTRRNSPRTPPPWRRGDLRGVGPSPATATTSAPPMSAGTSNRPMPAARPSALPANSSAIGTPVVANKRIVPRSRSPVQAEKPSAMMSSGISSVSTAETLRRPKRASEVASAARAPSGRLADAPAA